MIEVEGLRYRYPGATADTLKGLSFSVQDQEVFGFLGPSGAGKSTTQKVLIGLLRGYEGKVAALGRELSTWSHDFYEEVGVSFELPNHYQRLTAFENLTHFGRLYRKPRPPLEVLEWVGLANAAHQRVSEFSKGMKVRLNVARSLLHRPRLVFLDEPTGGLDPVNARNIKALVKRVRDDGATIFVTTHDMTVADELCDRVAFITDGELRALDAPSSLRRTYGRRSVAVEWTSSEGTETTEYPLDDLGRNQAFLSRLREARIESIHSQETTLENVFVQVTGEALRP